MNTFSNIRGDDIIDVRDIIERIEELQGVDWEDTEPDDRDELTALLAVMDELAGQGGDERWQGTWYPLTLIADHYFTEAMRELVSDIGDLPAEVPSYIEIDWDATANNLRVDYTSIEVDGTTYWFR